MWSINPQATTEGYKSMEALLLRAATLAAVLFVSMGADYRSANFIVRTGDPNLSQKIAVAAEKYRKELAVEWTGQEMPNWSAPCVMTVNVGPNLGAGGATTFVFDKGEVYGWQMTIQGSVQRIFDSVLPHEITHMIFASHFRCPLPRWADEGAASSVEHISERDKHHRMLVRFLQTGRGIAFNRMFAMKEYPRDVMPLYAQGLTLAEFLIQQGGRRKFIEYLDDGMKTGQWSEATRRHYEFADLGTLQNQWVAWVGQGLPAIQSPTAGARNTPPTMLADARNPLRPKPNPIRPASNEQPDSGWYAVGARPAAKEPQPADPVRSQLARPQSIERSRQIILQWDRSQSTSTRTPKTVLR